MKNVLCPTPVLSPLDAADPRLPYAQLLPAPTRFERKLDAQIKCQKSKEVNSVGDDCVDVIWRIS